LNKLGLLVIPNSFALGVAHQAFDEPRRLKDGNADQNVRGVGAALVKTAIALAPTPPPKLPSAAVPEMKARVERPRSYFNLGLQRFPAPEKI
jgi:hypothetical protein